MDLLCPTATILIPENGKMKRNPKLAVPQGKEYEMPRKRSPRKREAPLTERFIYGEVESWHVLMVAHNQTVEVPQERAQHEERQCDGGILYTHRAVSDHLSLEMDVVLREPVRGFDRLQFGITEWEAEEYGGIAGELSYDKESGLRGYIHMSGSFPRDLFALLRSGSQVAFGIETKEGFYRRSAWVTSLAFSDAQHPQWVDQELGLI